MIPTCVSFESLLLEVARMLDLLVQFRGVKFGAADGHGPLARVRVLSWNVGRLSVAELEELFQSQCVHGGVNACFADKEVMIDHGDVILRQLNIKLHIRRAQIGRRNKRLDCILSQLQRVAAGKILPQSAVSNDHR